MRDGMSDAEHALHARVRRGMFTLFGPAPAIVNPPDPPSMPRVTVALLTPIIAAGLAEGCDSERIAKRIVTRCAGGVVTVTEGT